MWRGGKEALQNNRIMKLVTYNRRNPALEWWPMGAHQGTFPGAKHPDPGVGRCPGNLRTFVAVADAGSLPGAPRQMGIAASSIAASIVTKRIDQLEWRVQARVFTRSTKRVTLMEFGTRYLSSSRWLIHDTMKCSRK